MHDRLDTAHRALPDQDTADGCIAKAKAPSSFFLGYGKSEVMPMSMFRRTTKRLAEGEDQDTLLTEVYAALAEFANSEEGQKLDANTTVKAAIGLTTVTSQSFSAVLDAILNNQPVYASESQITQLGQYDQGDNINFADIKKDSTPAMYEGVQMLIDCCAKANEGSNLQKIRSVSQTENKLIQVIRLLHQ